MERKGLRVILVLAACLAAGEGVGNTPAWGREAIFYTAIRPANWDIYLFERPEKPPRRLTTHPALDYNAVFSPDGRWVVFCSERRGNPDLFVLDLVNPGPPRPLTESPAMEDAPSISPDGKTIAFVSSREGNADIFVMPFRPEGPPAEKEAVNITRHRGGDFNPAFSPDGRFIAFSSDRDQYHASEIYVMKADGSAPTRLTQAPGWDGSPAWSGDGKRIFFYSQRQGGLHLYSMNPDGADQQPVFPRFNFPETLSPASATAGRIGFSSRDNGVWQIFSALPNGADQQLESDRARHYWAPAFHPATGRMVCHGPGDGQEAPLILEDGARLEGTGVPGPFLVDNTARVTLPDRDMELRAVRTAFPSLDPSSGLLVGADHFKSIVTSKPDGTELRQVFQPPGPRQSTWGPAWSPDGRWIAASVGPTFAGVGGRVDIWKFRSDGRDAVNLTGGSGGSNGFPYFSPDGRWIVFRSDRDGNMEIYRMNLDGTNPVRLTRHEGVDTMPAFAPASDRIAFVSRREGDFEIYTLALGADGTPGELLRITNSPGHDMHPKFSPDGKWIVFASERGGLNDEEPLIPVFNPQPYGEIFALRLSDGLTVRLTHNKWEDGVPSWAILP
ncbi:MAG: PD40 domain-containing protein [Deltaproteobacteria bacterium]|nr:PD40 domain-containing protein [Deltaproteobacteria bacterium]